MKSMPVTGTYSIVLETVEGLGGGGGGCRLIPKGLSQGVLYLYIYVQFPISLFISFLSLQLFACSAKSRGGQLCYSALFLYTGTCNV